MTVIPIDNPIVTSESVPFTADDKRKLDEIHEAITKIAEAVGNLPLDKLAKSPIGRMFGL